MQAFRVLRFFFFFLDSSTSISFLEMTSQLRDDIRIFIFIIGTINFYVFSNQLKQARFELASHGFYRI